MITPETETWTRAGLSLARDLTFPLLIRAPGFHAGQHFHRVENRDELTRVIATLPNAELLTMRILDARGADGMTRKYRVMFIGGVRYPVHLAISPDWKVHYFTAAMADNRAFREEERRFLGDMQGVLGQRAMTALAAIGQTLGLDYAGADFAIAADGSVQLFEANATMVVNPSDPGTMWDYRREPIAAVLDAARQLLRAPSVRASTPEHRLSGGENLDRLSRTTQP